MDWAEFIRTSEWAQLSVRQKFWLQTYLAGNDRVLATQCAYGTTGPENTRIFSYEVRKHPAIQAALNRYWNRSPREILLRDLQANIKATKPGSMARIKAQALYAKLLAGGKIPKSKPSSSKKSKRRTR